MIMMSVMIVKGLDDYVNDAMQGAFNSVLQEVLATGDFAEGGCGDSDSAEGR
jgi:hypothetical protein